MRAIMVMYDTLCRRMLAPYGCRDVLTPNFDRLARRTVQFQNAYVGSMPCMPARREMHTGRHNFLHRSWGPLEPFDDSMPELLSRAGVFTCKVTDHYHYWEDGGATYHNRYNAYEFVRGQEGDSWIGFAGDVKAPAGNRNGIREGRVRYGDRRTQDWVNREFAMRCDEETAQHRTFEHGLAFMRRNRDCDNWFLQIETFDPHEPFFSMKKWQDLYPHDWDGTVFDWPPYERCNGDARGIARILAMYKALLTFCDAQLGRVLDLMDAQDMWKDTMLIVNTDHGFLLGEHDWWAKCRMPFYQEVAHIPLWIWDPRGGARDARRESLVQTMDLAPTLLEFFGQPIPADMQGRPLRGVVERDAPIRDYALYGIHGGHVNITDGRTVYMRAPVDVCRPLYNYTVMPTHMTSRFSVAELRDWEKHPGFVFTKGAGVMQINATPRPGSVNWLTELTTRLYDLERDYGQERPIRDDLREARMIRAMVERMAASEAPPELYHRLGLPRPEALTEAAVAQAIACAVR